MSKTLLSISRRIAGKSETVELAGQPALAMRIGSLKHYVRRPLASAPLLAAPRARGVCGAPSARRRPRRHGSQPGGARCSATFAGAGQASQDGGGERCRGAPGGTGSGRATADGWRGAYWVNTPALFVLASNPGSAGVFLCLVGRHAGISRTNKEWPFCCLMGLGC